MSEKEREFKEHSERLDGERRRKMADIDQKSLYKAICLQEQTEEHYRQRYVKVLTWVIVNYGVLLD